MENILLDQVLQQVQNKEISIEKARELICVLFDVVKQSELLKDEEIPKIDNWIKDLGYTQITFSFVYKNGGTYKDREQLCKEYKKEFCL